MFNLIKQDNFKKVLKFSMIYRFIMQLLITPFFLYLGKLLLNYHKVQFMSTETALFLLTKPSVLIFIVFGLGILMFLLMIELSSVIVLAEYEKSRDNLLPYGINKLKWTLRPRNLKFLPLLIVILLGFHYGMSTIITDAFFIPEFIMDTILKTPSFLFLYTVFSIIAFIVAFYLVFIFHNLFIAEVSVKEAVSNSVSMVSKNKVNFLVAAIKLGIKISVFSLLVYSTVIFTFIFIFYVIPPLKSFNALSLSILFLINKATVFIIVNIVSAINVVFLNQKYHEYKGVVAKSHPVLSKPNHTHIPLLKYALLGLLITTLLVQGYGAYKTTMTFENPEFLEHKIYITSHRGNSSDAPENTITAIRAAKKVRADAAEIDVQLTKDGHVVVIHDFKLNRLAKDPRTVVDLTLAELKALEVGSWFSNNFKGEKIPTLNEVIEEAGNAIKLNIELKPSNDEKELANAVIEILKQYNYFDHTVISSLNKEALFQVKKIKPSLSVGYIVPFALGSFDFEENIDFYSIEMSFLSKGLVEQLKNQGKEVHAWTVNSEADLKKMQRLEVNSIITDNPVLAKKVLSTNLLEKGILEILSLLD